MMGSLLEAQELAEQIKMRMAIRVKNPVPVPIPDEHPLSSLPINFPYALHDRRPSTFTRWGTGMQADNGTELLPIQPGTYKRIAVKIVDHQGIKRYKNCGTV